MKGQRIFLIIFLILSALGISQPSFADILYYNSQDYVPRQDSFRSTVLKSLKGNRFSLIEENAMADREGLSRISNESTLSEMRKKGTLVPLPQSYKLKIDARLKERFRWCRPWVPKFLSDFSAEYFRIFHLPLKTNSAIRTVEYQSRLRRTNSNAASPHGPLASTHPTGATIDIAKKDMSPRELYWVRQYLLKQVLAGKIHVIEEFQQSVFHIMVSKYYSVKKKVTG